MTSGDGPSVTRTDSHGLPALRLSSSGGATAVVSLHGAHLLSWVPAGGREWLFVSERAEFGRGKAIRGGVPICFPQFSALGPLPRHGLVRTRPWRVEGQGTDRGTARVVLRFEPDAEARAHWPGGCRLRYAVQLEESRLVLELAAENTGKVPIAFTAALHGYFAVGDVEAPSVGLAGLRGAEYRDAADGDRLKHETAERVGIRGEVDRVYRSVSRPVLLHADGRTLRFEAEGFRDVVVWNPGAAKGDALADLAPGAWRRMLCVEAGAVRDPVVVPPGGRWVGRQLLSPVEP